MRGGTVFKAKVEEKVVLQDSAAIEAAAGGPDQPLKALVEMKHRLRHPGPRPFSSVKTLAGPSCALDLLAASLAASVCIGPTAQRLLDPSQILQPNKLMPSWHQGCQ